LLTRRDSREAGEGNKIATMRLRFLFCASVVAFLFVSGAGSVAATQGSRAAAPSGISLETSEQLFATMCALDAAGFDAEAVAGPVPASVASLRRDLLQLQGPAVEAVRAFYRDHQLADPEETLSRYISFALVLGPPPKFNYLLPHDQLPPDVLAIEGFNDVLAAFYAEANLARRWSQVEPDYNAQVRRMEGPVRQVVMISSAYLREIQKPSGPRSFAVLVEALVGNRTNFRSYGEHYAVVVGAGTELPLDTIRHAYLHFLLDPLALRYREAVESKHALLDAAARAPRLPRIYQKDFVAFLTECLIRAVELRLRRVSPAQIDAELFDFDRNGLVLVRPLLKRLEVFEKAEPAMSYYYPDLVKGIDVAAEQKRLQNVEFASANAPASETPEESRPAPPSELDLWLDEGDHDIALQDGKGAAEVFERVLAKYPNVPRALYGLAVASVLEKNIEKAKGLFQELVAASAPTGAASDASGPADPKILAWSHIYLGRIHDREGNHDLALSEYRAALAVEGAPDAARLAAQRGVEAETKMSPNSQPQER
jgi:tetratricopeptide (TPR) repeat protein